MPWWSGCINCLELTPERLTSGAKLKYDYALSLSNLDTVNLNTTLQDIE